MLANIPLAADGIFIYLICANELVSDQSKCGDRTFVLSCSQHLDHLLSFCRDHHENKLESG